MIPASVARDDGRRGGAVAVEEERYLGRMEPGVRLEGAQCFELRQSDPRADESRLEKPPPRRCTWPYVDMRAPNLMRVFIVYPLGVESILLRAGPSVKRTFLLRGSIRATYVS